MAINQNNNNKMSSKLITASLRDNSSGKRTLFINLRPNIVEELKLKDSPHVEITRNSDRYRIKFLTKQTARSRKISFKESYAYVGFAPEVFKITHDEPVSSFPIEADVSGDGELVFDFDTEEFTRPRATATNTQKINSAEDKVAAGFKPDSAWGVKVQEDVDAKIERTIEESMKHKFSVGNTGQLELDFDKVDDYSCKWFAYASITQKGAK